MCHKEAGTTYKGGYIVINGRPCKVVEISTSRTMSGHKKCRFVATDLFTNETLEDSSPASHNCEVPNVVYAEYTVLKIVDGDKVSLMFEGGDTRELDLPPDEALRSQIKDGLGQDKELSLTVVSAMDACTLPSSILPSSLTSTSLLSTSLLSNSLLSTSLLSNSLLSTSLLSNSLLSTSHLSNSLLSNSLPSTSPPSISLPSSALPCSPPHLRLPTTPAAQQVAPLPCSSTHSPIIVHLPVQLTAIPHSRPSLHMPPAHPLTHSLLPLPRSIPPFLPLCFPLLLFFLLPLFISFILIPLTLHVRSTLPPLSSLPIPLPSSSQPMLLTHTSTPPRSHNIRHTHPTLSL
ncbi:unnamed protein product [Closterium sp. Yama58-4]|nr:unnamed protein product [Closterium sp. Yama58-4]